MGINKTLLILITLGVLSSNLTKAEDLDKADALAMDILKQLVEINTTHSVGNSTKAAQAMANRLLDAGLPKSDVKNLERAKGRGNLIARLRSKKPTDKKPILFMALLDVVEADPNDCTIDPFKLTEDSDYFYGRGVLDDKAMAAVFVANFIRYLEEDFQPKRDIILVLTGDEELGGSDGIRWLVADYFNLFEAEFALNEGGFGQRVGNKKMFHAVQAAEKVYQSFTLTVKNSGEHSSQPRPDNAIYQLSNALVNLSHYQFPIKINEFTKKYVELTSMYLIKQDSVDLMSIINEGADQGVITRVSENTTYNSLLRTFCVATLLDAGHAENALAKKATATVNRRILPTDNPKDVQQTLQVVVDDPSVLVKPLGSINLSPPSPLKKDVFDPIQKVTNELWSTVPVVPTMSEWATDAVALRASGVPVYGVSGFFGYMNDIRVHGQDERILKVSFFEGLEFMYRLTKEFVK